MKIFKEPRKTCRLNEDYIRFDKPQPGSSILGYSVREGSYVGLLIEEGDIIQFGKELLVESYGQNHRLVPIKDWNGSAEQKEMYNRDYPKHLFDKDIPDDFLVESIRQLAPHEIIARKLDKDYKYNPTNEAITIVMVGNNYVTSLDPENFTVVGHLEKTVTWS